MIFIGLTPIPSKSNLLDNAGVQEVDGLIWLVLVLIVSLFIAMIGGHSLDLHGHTFEKGFINVFVLLVDVVFDDGLLRAVVERGDEVLEHAEVLFVDELHLLLLLHNDHGLFQVLHHCLEQPLLLNLHRHLKEDFFVEVLLLVQVVAKHEEPNTPLPEVSQEGVRIVFLFNSDFLEALEGADERDESDEARDDSAKHLAAKGGQDNLTIEHCHYQLETHQNGCLSLAHDLEGVFDVI